MSANAEVLFGAETISSRPRVSTPAFEVSRGSSSWSPERFASEQILGLVRRVFFSNHLRPIKQVAFCAVEPHINVSGICEQVAWALSGETGSQIALMDWQAQSEKTSAVRANPKNPVSIKFRSTQLSSNLWRIRQNCIGESANPAPGPNRNSWLAELRDQFEFTIIPSPVAGVLSEAALLGQITDGLILILGAHTTRKATAKQIKETLEGSGARILGIVLCERTFPIPQGIYNRL